MVVVVVPYLWCIALSCPPGFRHPERIQNENPWTHLHPCWPDAHRGGGTGRKVTIVSGVLGPEGPLFVDGNLYFVAWTSGTLSKWDGKNTTVLNSQPGCSHNGLALTKQKTFLQECCRASAARKL